MVVIVDYGMGNLGSIVNMLKKIGVAAVVSRDPARIADATKLIVPGVGAFGAGMRNLRDSGVIPALERRVLGDAVPTLGICLGMQLMVGSSEEGDAQGLGWIAGRTVRFSAPAGERLRVPHMGWNVVHPLKPHPLLSDMEGEQRFYFVHSYRVECADRADALLGAEYGRPFDAAFQRGNLMGVQFHPEKSHRFGMRLLRNFIERC